MTLVEAKFSRSSNEKAAFMRVRNLDAHYPGPEGPLPVLHDLSLTLHAGESLGIIGETGSGKTTLARCLMGLLPWSNVQGSIRLEGQELVGLDEAAMRQIRWRRVALAFQGAGGGFDPVYPVGQQIVEPLQVHLGLNKKAAEARTYELLEQVSLPRGRFSFYPHQLSGGEKQRAMIAMALSCDPQVLIVDEPTTGLDVVTQAQVLALLARLKVERELALIIISHNLTDVGQLAEQTAVLYGGRVMEVAPTEQLFDDPRHPYTWGLLNAYPTMSSARNLQGIRGAPPPPGVVIPGCPFHPRCSQAVVECGTEFRPLETVGAGERRLACLRGGLVTLLSVQGLRKSFGGGCLFSRNGREAVTAVAGVDLTVRHGEVVALVGQTGSGKTTLGKMILRLVEPEEGTIVFDGKELLTLEGEALKEARRQIQMIFQEPFAAVSPRLTINEIVREPLDIQKIGSEEEREARVAEALQAVNLPASAAFRSRYVHQISGGQAQRVVIARALILAPRLLVADEPVSMLDASEQAKLLNLLKRLQNEHGISLLIITHDLALVRKVADRIYVMQAGCIVESGLSDQIITSPQHPHTQALLAASPRRLGAGNAGPAGSEKSHHP